MNYYISLQLTVNGKSLVNGVAVLKHVQEERNHVQDPSRLKQKMVEMPVLGMKLRLNSVIQLHVQVNANNYLLPKVLLQLSFEKKNILLTNVTYYIFL